MNPLRTLAALAVLGVVALVVVLALVFGGNPAAKPQAQGRTAATATPTPTATPESTPKPSKPVKAHATKKTSATPVALPTKPPAPVFTACDPNITVRSATTTCGLAESTFYEYSQAGGGVVRAYSTTADQWFTMRCRGSSRVICKDGSEVHFAQSAVGAYTYENAVNYASSHKVSVGPDGEGSTPAVAPDVAPDPAPVIEPDPTQEGTSPGENIPNYDRGNGYRVQCSDGMYSQSGGIQGACSRGVG
jgi:hypothetical protein